MNVKDARGKEVERHERTMATLDLIDEFGICGFVTHCCRSDIYLEKMDTIAEVIRVVSRLGRYEMKHYYLSDDTTLAINYPINERGVEVIAYVPIEYLESVGPNCKIVETTVKEIVCTL